MNAPSANHNHIRLPSNQLDKKFAVWIDKDMLNDYRALINLHACRVSLLLDCVFGCHRSFCSNPSKDGHDENLSSSVNLH